MVTARNDLRAGREGRRNGRELRGDVQPPPLAALCANLCTTSQPVMPPVTADGHGRRGGASRLRGSIAPVTRLSQCLRKRTPLRPAICAAVGANLSRWSVWHGRVVIGEAGAHRSHIQAGAHRSHIQKPELCIPLERKKNERACSSCACGASRANGRPRPTQHARDLESLQSAKKQRARRQTACPLDAT